MAKDETTRGGGSRTGSGGLSGQPKVNGRWLPVTLRLRVVKEVLEHGAKATDVARVFGVGVATINGWCRTYQAGGPEALIPKAPSPPPRPKAADPKREAVAALKREQPELGTRRISDMLRRFEALGVSESQVRRILHEEGLLEARPPPPEKEHGPRRFERAAPNQLWQSDIFTFLLRRHQRL